jgi:predicted RNA binding protein YcfA (HicA-like mRNA interferase family)
MPMKYREVRGALKEAGWELLRQRGSHEVWGRPGETTRIVVAGKEPHGPGWHALCIHRASGLEHLR